MAAARRRTAPVRDWIGGALYATAALAGVIVGLTVVHFALVGVGLLLSALGPSAMLEVRRAFRRARNARAVD